MDNEVDCKKNSKKKFRNITVITVVLNGEKILEETILSVINQTYDDIEYIIIDGESTDNTLDIIKKYELQVGNEKSSNISFHYISEADNGIYYAMNKGIDMATGSWIIFMNAGDSFFSHSVLNEFMKKRIVNSSIIYGDMQLILKKRNKIIRPKSLSKKNHMTFCHQASFVRASVMKKLHFDTTYKICADRDFFWKAFNCGYLFQYIPIVICNYEGEKGISTMNRVQMRQESGHIDGSDQKMWWRFKQFILIIVCTVKSRLRHLIFTYP